MHHLASYLNSCYEFSGGPSVVRGTTYGAVDFPAGPSMETKFAVDAIVHGGTIGGVIDPHLMRIVQIDCIRLFSRSQTAFFSYN